MKNTRYLSATLIVVLLLSLCGCSSVQEPAAPIQPNDTATAESAAPSSCPNTEGTLYLYKDRAYYEPKADQHRICVASMDQKETCILQDGHLLGLYGSLLLAHDDEKYLMMDLEKGSDWKPLQNRTANEGGFGVLGKETFFYFGFVLDENQSESSFVDVVDLQTMDSKRVWIDRRPLWATVENDVLYYAYIPADSSALLLCQADLNKPKESVLYRSETVYNHFHKTANRILFYDNLKQPTVYNIETHTASALPFDNRFTFHVADELLFAWSSYVDGLQVYNLNEETLRPAETSKIHIFENGYGYPLPPLKKGDLEIHIGEKTFVANFNEIAQGGRSVKQIANEYLYAFLLEEKLVLYDWNTKKHTTVTF